MRLNILEEYQQAILKFEKVLENEDYYEKALWQIVYILFYNLGKANTAKRVLEENLIKMYGQESGPDFFLISHKRQIRNRKVEIWQVVDLLKGHLFKFHSPEQPVYFFLFHIMAAQILLKIKDVDLQGPA